MHESGLGASTIKKELQRMNIKTKKGHDRWPDTVITGIIKNEYGVNMKRIVNSIPIRIAGENE